jgi:hypothetical protein
VPSKPITCNASKDNLLATAVALGEAAWVAYILTHDVSIASALVGQAVTADMLPIYVTAAKAASCSHLNILSKKAAIDAVVADIKSVP